MINMQPTLCGPESMRNGRARHALLTLCVLLLGTSVFAAESKLEQHWQVVLFDGLKAGHALSEREEWSDRVRTRESMTLQLKRAGVSIDMSSMEESIEAIDGTALAFSAEMTMSGTTSRFVGERQADGSFMVVTEVGGAKTESRLTLPKGALLFEAQRKAVLATGMQPGSQVEFLAFQPSLQQSVRVVTTIGERSNVEVLDRDLSLIEVQQSIYYADPPVHALAFVDPNYVPQRISMDMLGMKIEMVRCDRECALAPNQGAESLQQLLLKVPNDERINPHQPIRFRLSGDGMNALPKTGHQQPQLGGWLRVNPQPGIDLSEAKAEDLASTPWLQSDNQEIIDLARKALGQRGRPATQRMSDAEAFVARYIDGKTLSVGYASALEVARSRRGDCTEHALLLAALGRAEGIPTRVVTGFAYVSEFAGQRSVFVPHAWIEARTEKGWTGYDAALGEFNSGHIALALGNGDPTRFYASINMLGSMRISDIESIASP